jgi:hypothetical protein
MKRLKIMKRERSDPVCELEREYQRLRILAHEYEDINRKLKMYHFERINKE